MKINQKITLVLGLIVPITYVSTSVGPVGGSGGSPVPARTCSSGYVTEIYGGAGQFVDRVGMKCSNGQDLGTMGGGGGAAYSFKNPRGFSGMDTRSGGAVDAIKPLDTNGQSLGEAGGNGGNPGSLRCPQGQRIVGFAGRSGAYTDALQVSCAVRADDIHSSDKNNISFVNDSDKKVYLCRDKDSLGVIEPKATACYGEEFFKGTFSKPMPRYFKISFSDKPCTETPDVKYALATGKNYRITTQAALKTEENWPNGCPLLTPAQQAAEAASGGVLQKVVGGSMVLADDIKGGVLKGWDETKGFITDTAPNAVKDAYKKTADFITKDVGSKFEQFGSSVASGATTAAEKTKQGVVDAAYKVGDVAKDIGNAIAGSKANPGNW